MVLGVLSLLILGGLSSVALNFLLPNAVRRARLREEIKKLRTLTRGISPRVDSRLRVDLGVERLRILAALEERSWASLELSATLVREAANLKRLTRRVELTRTLDDRLKQREILQDSGWAPPSLLREASLQLGKAAARLSDTAIEDAEILQARTSIEQGGRQLDEIGQENEEFAAKLAGSIKRLRESYEKLGGEPIHPTPPGDAGSQPAARQASPPVGRFVSPPTAVQVPPRAAAGIGSPPAGEAGDDSGKPGFHEKRQNLTRDLRKKLPDLFEALRPEYETSENVERGKYYWLDHSIERLYVLRHYILRFADTGEATDKAGKEWHEEIVGSQDDLLDLLRQRTWASLAEARRLRRRIDEGFFTDDVTSAIEEGAVVVVTRPRTPRVNESVTLCARFRDPKLQACSARRDFSCVWDFKEIGEERGWEISHYFAKVAPYTLEVEFRDGSGALVPYTAPKPTEGSSEDGEKAPSKVVETESVEAEKPREGCLHHKVNVEKRSDAPKARMWVGVFRFSLVMFITLLGLVAGTREQIEKFDLVTAVIAVFLAGFGADAIKNLLTKSSANPQPAERGGE